MMSRFLHPLPALAILSMIGTLPLQADLVAHYSFDENVPDDLTVLDSLGRNNGTFINSSNSK